MLTESMTRGLSVAAAPVHPHSVSIGTADTGGIDMTVFLRAMFVLDVGVFGGGGTVDFKLQECDDPGFGSGVTDITNAAITQLVAAGGNNRLATLEVNHRQTTKRYVRARATVAVASTFLQILPLACNPTNDPASAQDVAAVAQRKKLTTGAVSQWAIHGTSAIVTEL